MLIHTHVPIQGGMSPVSRIIIKQLYKDILVL